MGFRILTALAAGVLFTLGLAGNAQAHDCHRNVQTDERGAHYHDPDAGQCHRVEAPDPNRQQIERAYPRPPKCRRVCQFVGTAQTCRIDCETFAEPR